MASDAHSEGAEAAAAAAGVASPVAVHVLLLSFPIPSHLNPILQLARKLSSLASRLSCSFVFTSIVSFHVSSTAPPQPSDSVDGSFTLRTIAVPDGLPFSHPRSGLLHAIQSALGLRPAVEQFLPQLLQTRPPLTCIIADVFVPWAPQVASKFGIPLFSFFTSNASACCVMSHAPELLSKGILPLKAHGDSKQRITFPGAPSLLPTEFPPSMQADDISTEFQFTLKMFQHLEQAAGLVLNTSYELEAKAIDFLRSKCPVFTVGPLLLPSGEEIRPVQQEVNFWPAEDRCLAWLDTQAALSVLYVSFGSISTFSSPELIRELALGLEASEQPFLWVIRHDAVNGSLSEVLPEGFLDRTTDRSLIISWAPQLRVLQHRAVGGFLSHCGWNSTLENIALGGIPMLCWPDIAEQKLNARLLMDDWKLGLEFSKKEDGKVSHEEVERMVRVLMQGQEGRERRKRAAELKSQVQKAVKQGGSSFRNVEDLVKNMKDRVQRVTTV